MLGLFFFVRRSPYFGRRFCGRGAASAAVVEKIGGESFGDCGSSRRATDMVVLQPRSEVRRGEQSASKGRTAVCERKKQQRRSSWLRGLYGHVRGRKTCRERRKKRLIAVWMGIVGRLKKETRRSCAVESRQTATGGERGAATRRKGRLWESGRFDRVRENGGF